MAQITYTNLVDGVALTASDLNTRFLLAINALNNGIDADNLASNAVTTAKIANDAVTFDKMDDDGDFGPFTGDWSYNEIAFPEVGSAPSTDVNEVKLYAKNNGSESGLFFRKESDGAEVELGASTVVQIVNVQDGDVATGTTNMPDDNTIPQNTEGTEFMTLAITPTSATNKLKIDVVWYGECSSNMVAAALFQDSTAGALAAGQKDNGQGNLLSPIVFSHYMTSGTTSATTFKVRAGGIGGNTTTFNGESSARKLGGVCASSITITEIKV